jgi:hypothetical protein
MGRVLALALDGYEYTVAEELGKAGYMPTLAKIRNRSAKFLLNHGSALRTGLAGEHVATGMSPDRATRWSALSFDPHSYQISQKGTQFAPFPSSLHSKTVVFDLPYFDLQRAPDVCGISNWGAHDPGVEFSGNPSGLAAELLKKFGHYPAKNFLYGTVWPSATKCEMAGRQLTLGVRNRAEIAAWLLNDRFPDWDLALIGVSETHSGIEALWHGYDPQHPLHSHASAPAARRSLLDIYMGVDRLISRLVDLFPDAEILIFSLHGMGPNKSDVASMVLLPELLHRHAFGTPFFADRRDTGDKLVPILAEDERWQVAQATPRKVASSLETIVRKLVPPSVANAIPRVIKREAIRALKGWGPYSERKHSVEWIPATQLRPLWPKMRAFALPSYYDGRVRINLEGREQNGQVPLSKYKETCDEIVALVRECRDIASGNGVVAHVEYGNRLLPLELHETAADLTFVWNEASLGFEHPRLGRIGPIPFRRTGGHTGAYGVAYLSSGRIQSGEYGERTSFDVVPTLFDLLGQPCPGHISGRSLLAALA